MSTYRHRGAGARTSVAVTAAINSTSTEEPSIRWLVRAAAGMLRETAEACRGGAPMDRAFEAVDADPDVRGHAWRSIRSTIGEIHMPVLWQRDASPAEVLDMLERAAARAERTPPAPIV